MPLRKAGGRLADFVQFAMASDCGRSARTSSATTIAAVANPDPKLEIQGYAVIGSK